MEGREQVTRIWIIRVNALPEELDGPDGRRQPSMGGTSRMSREAHVQICERLGVQFPGATRPKVGQGRACTTEAKAFSFTHRTKVFAGGTVPTTEANGCRPRSGRSIAARDYKFCPSAGNSLSAFS
jgi:hypothetical protein